MKVEVRWISGEKNSYEGVTVMHTIVGAAPPGTVQPGELWLTMGQVAALRVFNETTNPPGTFDG